MSNQKDQKQRLQEKRALELLENWIRQHAPLCLSLHLNVGMLTFLGELQKQGENFMFRNRKKDFGFVFSPNGSARIRLRTDGNWRSLEIDWHRYLIEGVRAGLYDALILQEVSGAVDFSSFEELATTNGGPVA